MGTVAGLFETRGEAENAIEQLRNAGVSTKDIGIALKDSGETREAAKTTGVETVASSAGGPLAAALNAIGAGGVVGGLSGVLTKAGIPKEEAETYQSCVQQGGVLITAEVPDEQESAARNLMQQCGCMDPNRARSLMQSNPDYQFGQHTAETATAAGGSFTGAQSDITGSTSTGTQSDLVSNQPYSYETPGRSQDISTGSGQGYSSTMPADEQSFGRNPTPNYTSESDQGFARNSSDSGQGYTSEDDLEIRHGSSGISSDPYQTSTGSRGNAAEGFSSGEDTNIRQGSSAIHPESDWPSEHDTGYSSDPHHPEERRMQDKDQGFNATGSDEPML